jgi:hypothetical protein
MLEGGVPLLEAVLLLGQPGNPLIQLGPGLQGPFLPLDPAGMIFLGPRLVVLLDAGQLLSQLLELGGLASLLPLELYLLPAQLLDPVVLLPQLQPMLHFHLLAVLCLGSQLVLQLLYPQAQLLALARHALELAAGLFLYPLFGIQGQVYLF